MRLWAHCVCSNLTYVFDVQMEAIHDLALRLWSDYEWALSISGNLCRMVLARMVESAASLFSNASLSTVM